MVGRTFNHYRVVSAIGQGGMGAVYLAEDLRLKRRVALKFLPDEVGSDPTRLERLAREAQAVAALNHPNIVTVHAIERDGDTHFIAMEYLEGRTLDEFVRKGGMPLDRFLPLVTQIVDAVVAAHRHGIVHRDLKPRNVMVLDGDRVKVLDFGLAKLREAPDAATLPTRELTGEGRIVGTVAYMSPEQAEGKPVDERSDVFALGIILYELVTGERPFTGETSMSVLSAILRDTPRAITEITPGLPRDLWRIVRHCLAKDPDRRYQSAKDLRNDLDDLAQSLSSGELTPAVPAHRAPRPGWWAFAGMAAALVAVGWFAWLQRAPASSGDAAAPTLSHNRLTQGEAGERFPTLSPDGRWVAYATQGDIYLQSVTGQTAINLTQGSPSVETTPAFSPDGETIAFRSSRDGGGIFLMGRTGESIRRLTADGFQPGWFPDGKSIVYASGESPAGPENRTAFSELWTVSIDGGEPRRLFAGDAVQPRVSPNGRRIAFWSLPADVERRALAAAGVPANREIWSIDSRGLNPVRVAGHDANDWNPVWGPDGRWLYFLSNRSGSMALWRIAIDEASGETSGEPQPLTAPAWYVADFALSADGSVGVYSSLTATSNVYQVAFDPKTATVKGAITAITTGTNDFVYLDVTKDGRYVAVTTSSRTKEDLYVITVADGSARQLTNDFDRDRWPRWAPDGRSIYFYSDRRGYDIWRINVDASGLRQLTNEPGLNQMYPALTADGARMGATEQDARKLAIYDTRDFSKPLQVIPLDIEQRTGTLRLFDWSPDGRALVIHAGSPGGLGTGGGGLWIHDLDTGTTRRFRNGIGATWLSDGRRLLVLAPNNPLVVDVNSGREEELPLGSVINQARLAVDDTQLFFLRPTGGADIWVARFGTPAKTP
jgi:Tol biopolymer transport system component/tRNA A-37 threonylcarbamoyl transferase component Bud32